MIYMDIVCSVQAARESDGDVLSSKIIYGHESCFVLKFVERHGQKQFCKAFVCERVRYYIDSFKI